MVGLSWVMSKKMEGGRRTCMGTHSERGSTEGGSSWYLVEGEGGAVATP